MRFFPHFAHRSHLINAYGALTDRFCSLHTRVESRAERTPILLEHVVHLVYRGAFSSLFERRSDLAQYHQLIRPVQFSCWRVPVVPLLTTLGGDGPHGFHGRCVPRLLVDVHSRGISPI